MKKMIYLFLFLSLFSSCKNRNGLDDDECITLKEQVDANSKFVPRCFTICDVSQGQTSIKNSKCKAQ